MIKAVDVARYSDLRYLISKTHAELTDLEAERNDLEASLVQAVIDRQRVQRICSFTLAVEKGEKSFNPPYKSCAMDLAGESAVKAWVKKHHPHEASYKLTLTAKPGIKVLISKAVNAALEAIGKVRRAE